MRRAVCSDPRQKHGRRQRPALAATLLAAPQRARGDGVTRRSPVTELKAIKPHSFWRWRPIRSQTAWKVNESTFLSGSRVERQDGLINVKDRARAEGNYAGLALPADARLKFYLRRITGRRVRQGEKWRLWSCRFCPGWWWDVLAGSSAQRCATDRHLN